MGKEGGFFRKGNNKRVGKTELWVLPHFLLSHFTRHGVARNTPEGKIIVGLERILFFRS